MSIRLVGENELWIPLCGVARASVSAVHPVHEVAVAVPDGEDEDHSTLESATHHWEATKAFALSTLGVTVLIRDGVEARPAGGVSGDGV